MDFLNPKIGGRSNLGTLDQMTSASPSAIYEPTQSSLFGKIINYCAIALLFLLPMFFLPITSEVREFNKQSLLISGVLVMLAVWVIKALSTKNISWVKTSLDYVVLAYGGIYVLASIFSLDRVSSFLGYWGRFSGSAVSAVALVLFYFLVVSNFRERKWAGYAINAFAAGSVLVLAYTLLQLTGHFLFGSFSNPSFNPVGSMVSASIFAAISILAYQWKLLSDPEASILKNILYGAATLLAIVVMFVINAFVGWLILSLGLILLISGTVVTLPSERQNTFWKPMFVMVVSILFLILQIFQSISINNQLDAWRAKLTSKQLPIEIQLANPATYSLVKNSLSSGIKNATFGSGPGTTGIAFGQLKPFEFNKTAIWSLNFDRASSELANIMIETGLLGLLAFEGLSIIFVVYAVHFLLRKAGHPGRMYALGFFTLWGALYLTHFFYFFNTTFSFLFWFSIAMFMAVAREHKPGELKELSFGASPRAALSGMFVSLLMLVLLLVGGFFEISVFTAETSYASGVKILNQSNPDFNRAQASFESAASLNPNRDVYHLGKSQNMIYLASIEAAKKDADVQKVIDWVQGAISEGQMATKVSPSKASNWSSMAQIYNSVRALDPQGSAKQAAKMWEQAIARDQKNPALYVQLASAYADSSTSIDPKILGTGADSDNDGLHDDMEATFKSDPNNSDTNGNGAKDGDDVLAGLNPAGVGKIDAATLKSYQTIDNAAIKQAVDMLNKAIELKPDLPDSYIALARVYEIPKKFAEARKVLDEAAIKFPYNANILFEQGRMTYNVGDAAAAEKIFNSVLKLQDKNADALFSLGVIYESKDKAKALSYYKKAREVSGPNVDLDKKINALEELLTPKQ